MKKYAEKALKNAKKPCKNAAKTRKKHAKNEIKNSEAVFLKNGVKKKESAV